MSQRVENDSIWGKIRSDVAAEAERESLLAGFLESAVLAHDSFEAALAFHLSEKLASSTVPAGAFRSTFEKGMNADPSIARSARADLEAVRDRDPACTAYWLPFLYSKGFHSIQVHRLANWLWMNGRRSLASHLQNRTSEKFGVDIHPAAHIGQGIFIDHATSVVIGETSVVEDDVSMLHEVTLGGTGKETGDRHPKVRRGVLICAGAKVLGNVEVGEGAKIAAGSVVLSDVAPHSTVAGIPAEVVGHPEADQPALGMDSRLGV
ncbi:MAG: serine O-acetyltransferase [Myxococcota bacterium]|nr:serine O-acetyltransferase [Myxococcota bacterium]